MRPERDLGDFQTPPDLVCQIVSLLDALGIPHSRVLEPTCGKGNFLSALLDHPVPPREMIGFEIQADHLEEAKRRLDPTVASLYLRDFFQADLTHLEWRGFGPLLVIGNPPWVTTAELGRLGSTRGPSRQQIVGVCGFDRLTGASNFDLAEAVWHKLLNQFDEPGSTIALLCKFVTARKVIRWAVQTEKSVESASIYRIDARKWFDAAVDACLLVVSLGSRPKALRVPVYSDLNSLTFDREIGVVDNLIVADMAAFERASVAFGQSPRVWRQGVKHDVAAVMELREHDGKFWNGLGEEVDIEAGCLYPLLKGSDLAQQGKRPEIRRRVIVTQHRLGEDTASLRERSPRLWAYLNRHAAVFEARKSRIYRDRPPFSMFGIGEYTFASYKVAIPGVHKSVRFNALKPVGDRPVLLDDTCYFLPCTSAGDSERTADLLNGPIARRLIAALRFDDAKRPITKSILQRIDLTRLDTEKASHNLAGGARVE